MLIKIDGDIWYLSSDEKHRCRVMNYNKEKDQYLITEIDSVYHSQIETLEFLGRPFRVPTKTKDYLTVMYGEDWPYRRHKCKSGDGYTRYWVDKERFLGTYKARDSKNEM